MEIHPPASVRTYELIWYRFDVKIWSDEECTKPLPWHWGSLVASTVMALEMHIESLLEHIKTDYWYSWEKVEDNVPAPRHLIEGGFGH